MKQNCARSSQRRYVAYRYVLHVAYPIQFGPVVDIRLVRDKAGRSKGFAFLEFAKKEAVAKALEKKDLEMDGRVVGIQVPS